MLKLFLRSQNVTLCSLGRPPALRSPGGLIPNLRDGRWLCGSCGASLLPLPGESSRLSLEVAYVVTDRFINVLLLFSPHALCLEVSKFECLSFSSLGIGILDLYRLGSCGVVGVERMVWSLLGGVENGCVSGLSPAAMRFHYQCA